jgi:hypothetical protein
MFGYCPLYSNKIYLWDLIAYPNFISKLTPNFVSFCKKIIYFPVKNSLFRIIKNNDQVEIKTHPAKCKQFLNTITNKSLITKLCKYYLYGDDPEITNLQYRFSFVEPISVPDCLLYMYSKTEDQKYMRIYSALNVKLNKTEEMVLEKFSPLVLNDIHKIDKAYPYFALRKIYIYNWYNNRISCTNDSFNVVNDCINFYNKIKSHKKIKYKITKTTKPQLLTSNMYYYRKRSLGNRISWNSKYEFYSRKSDGNKKYSQAFKFLVENSTRPELDDRNYDSDSDNY